MSGLKFRNQRDFFRTNFKDREADTFKEENKLIKQKIEGIGQNENVWPQSLLEIYNCD